MIGSVCVFCASSEELDHGYVADAQALGRLIGQRGWRMVFGGGTIGLMGAVARAVHAEGGHVTGVIPHLLNIDGVAYTACDELITTRDLRERKAEMDARSDAFIALPGGFGTLEEIAEHLALRQLNVHPRPVVLLNTKGFYDPLIAFFDHLIQERFAREEHRALYHLAANPADAVQYLENYRAPVFPRKVG